MTAVTDACETITGTENDGDLSLPTVRIGFIPLVDCAILVAAKEKGFADAQGIRLSLSKEASWSNIRDRLTVSQLDCAHMLAGMAIASTLEIGNPMARVIAPMALGLNGNAITVSHALWDRMAKSGNLSGKEGPAETGAALARVVAEDKAAGLAPHAFGVVYPYSSHNYALRYWMASAGIHPDRDVRLTVVPPPDMPDYLRDGYLDGFCVGEPWNSIAVTAGLGRIVVPTSRLWVSGPEKILGVRADWAEHNGEALDALVRALVQASSWAGRAENAAELSRILSQPDYLDIPAALIERILQGSIALERNSTPAPIDDYIVFDGPAAVFPWHSHALWLYSQMVRWGQVAPSPSVQATVAETYRPDIFRRALAGNDRLAGIAGNLPDKRLEFTGPEKFFDGHAFDPHQLDEYVLKFGIHSRRK